jgi:hypothetical protein
MADLFGMSGADKAKFQSLWSWKRAQSQGGGGDRRPEAFGARTNFTRVGVAYGAVPARSGTTPGRGECKFYRLNTTTFVLGDLDELPTTVYNYGSAEIADGEYLIAWLDQSGKFLDGGRTIGEATWATGSIDANESEPEAVKLIYLCKESNQAIAVGTEVKMTFQESRNFSTANHTPFDSGAAFDGIVMQKVGWYLFGYDISWNGPFTSPGNPGDGVSITNGGTAQLGFSEDGTGSTTIVPCSYKVVSSIKDLVNGTGLDGNASHVTLYQNTVEDRVMHLLLTSVASFSFPAYYNVFYAQYLHNLTVTETAP